MSLRVEPLETPKFRVSFKTGGINIPEKPVTTTLPIKNGGNENSDQNVIRIKKEYILPAVTSAVALTSLGVAMYSIKVGKKGPSIAEESKKLENTINSMKNDLTSVVNGVKDELTTKIEAVEKDVASQSKKIDSQGKHFTAWVQKAENIAVEAKNRALGRIKESNIVDKDGHLLKMNADKTGNRIGLPNEMVEKLRGTTQKYINGTNVAIATLGAGSSIWMPTAESIPEKTGGLGEVPPQLASNMTDINLDPVIIRPLIASNDKSEFHKTDDNKAIYWWHKGMEKNGEKVYMTLDKIAGFKVNSFRDGKTENETVEAFYAMDPKGHKRLMFYNEHYFTTPDLYAGEEDQRYSFFSRAVYEFMKIKLDPQSAHGYTIYNKDKYDEIKPPEAMVLNDWHTAPIAAMARYLAPIESHFKELDKKASSKIQDMNLLYLVHNSDHQGDDWAHTSEILNTLFGKYALDVYECSHTGFNCYGSENIWSSLLTNGNVNMANMAMCLATKVKPVSKTYAKEMATRSERSRALMHVSDKRLNAGTLVGQSNGWDRKDNEVASGTKTFNDTRKMTNNDRSLILKHVLGKLDLEVPNSCQEEFQAKLQEMYPGFDYKLPAFREIKPVVYTMPIDEIMANRNYNKAAFVQYLKDSVAYNAKAIAYNAANKDLKNPLPLLPFDATGVSDLSDVDMNKLDEIPVLTMGVRFVEQKGVDIIAKSITELMNNWDELYPGKERPIIVIGGQDDNGKYRAIAQKMKTDLGEKGKRVLYMDGYTPNPSFYAGSNFTLRPSHFEPDGDKWESLYRGTPLIMTRVGGHVDSIKDGHNGYLSSRTVADIAKALNLSNLKVGGNGPNRDNYRDDYLKAMSEDYTEAIKKGLNTYYDKAAYTRMVQNSIRGDQSWVLKQGDKIKDCPLVGHLRDLGVNFNDPDLAKYFTESVKNANK